MPGQPQLPSPDWLDASGKTYDAMGRNLTSDLFKQMWRKVGKKGLMATIDRHVAKADVTVFDVTNIGQTTSPCSGSTSTSPKTTWCRRW